MLYLGLHMLYRMGQNIKIRKFTSRCTDTNEVRKYKHQDEHK